MTFMMRPSVSAPTGTVIGAPVSIDLLAAHQTFGRVHGDDAHGVLAEMLGDFEHQPVAAVLGLQRVQDRRQMPVELHVDDGADDLAHLAGAPSARMAGLVAVAVTVSAAAFLARGAAARAALGAAALTGASALACASSVGVAVFAILVYLFISRSSVGLAVAPRAPRRPK